MNNVAFGQFYPVKSFVHRMDPRAKIVLLIAYIVAIFLVKDGNFWGLLAVFAFLAVAVAFSRVPIGSVLRSVKYVLFIIIFMSVLQIFFYRGDGDPLWQWKFITIYREALIYALFIAVRLLLLVMGSSILTLSTTPVSLTDGLESLLFPLKLIKFPVHELALIMSIALRFIPTLTEETSRIVSAQKARGANFEKGGLISRAKAMLPVLIPLLVSAFRRAEELGDAMDARCYRGGARTKFKKLKFGWRDLVATLLTAGLIVAVVLI